MRSSFRFRHPDTHPVLTLHGLWRLVSEPLLTPPYQNFALRNASIIHAALTPQGNRHWMTFGLLHVTGLQVIGANRDRDLLAVRGIYDGQTIKFDFGHHSVAAWVASRGGPMYTLPRLPVRRSQSSAETHSCFGIENLPKCWRIWEGQRPIVGHPATSFLPPLPVKAGWRDQSPQDAEKNLSPTGDAIVFSPVRLAQSDTRCSGNASAISSSG
jgi:hypothetical protein